MGKMKYLSACLVPFLCLSLATTSFADSTSRGLRKGSGGVDAPNVTRPLNPPQPSRANDAVSGNANQLANPSSVDGSSVNAAQRGTRPKTVASAPAWQQKQAEHAWNGVDRGVPRREEWRRLGINNKDQLQTHISEVRSTPDVSRRLNDTWSIHGKVHPGETTRGTIVIDNLTDNVNGGTAFTNPNVYNRVDELFKNRQISSAGQ